MKTTIEQLISEPQSIAIGQKILLSGTIYTARDAAHARIVSMLDNKENPPFNLKNSCIYYCGPAPAKPNQIIGACGPTTSSRMDFWTPRLLDEGVKILIGKGARNQTVVEAIAKRKALYFAATGGIAALLSKTVMKCDLTAFEDLGAEAIYKLEVKDMPLICAVDSCGTDLFKL
ncbi:MAG: FumA C-terminus/TtdB family hydratase beta subunit [Elusimicrobiota bacterium]|jgi:fumarate hydratase subunit beta|nr:FumA C-terminus/TtdB family hydratase beta subunit [Elusimicrobiota bacterium]